MYLYEREGGVAMVVVLQRLELVKGDEFLFFGSRLQAVERVAREGEKWQE